MSISAMNKPRDTRGSNADKVLEFFHHLTAARFLRLGISSVVYLRSCMADGDQAYAIHGADGALVGVVDDIDAAVTLASEHGMAVVAVH